MQALNCDSFGVLPVDMLACNYRDGSKEEPCEDYSGLVNVTICLVKTSLYSKPDSNAIYKKYRHCWHTLSHRTLLWEPSYVVAP